MVIASSAAELTKLRDQLKKAGLVELTLHAWRQAHYELSYSGVWHKTATGSSDEAWIYGFLDADLHGEVAKCSGKNKVVNFGSLPEHRHCYNP